MMDVSTVGWIAVITTTKTTTITRNEHRKPSLFVVKVKCEKTVASHQKSMTESCVLKTPRILIFPLAIFFCFRRISWSEEETKQELREFA